MYHQDSKGDRLVPFRGPGDQTLSAFEASQAYQQESLTRAVLYDAHYQPTEHCLEEREPSILQY